MNKGSEIGPTRAAVQGVPWIEGAQEEETKMRILVNNIFFISDSLILVKTSPHIFFILRKKNHFDEKCLI